MSKVSKKVSSFREKYLDICIYLWYYNRGRRKEQNTKKKGEIALGKKKKKPIKWREMAAGALIDLITGMLLILFSKYFG